VGWGCNGRCELTFPPCTAPLSMATHALSAGLLAAVMKMGIQAMIKRYDEAGDVTDAAAVAN